MRGRNTREVPTRHRGAKRLTVAIDYKAELDAKAWQLLEANSTFTATFPPLCRLKDDTKTPIERLVLRAGRDIKAQIRIEVQGGEPISTQQIRTFGMNSVNYTPSVVDCVRPCTAKMIVTMIFSKSTKKEDRMAADALVRQIFNGAWPKFGLSYVGDFSIGDTSGLKNFREIQQELITVIQTITFKLRPLASQLV